MDSCPFEQEGSRFCLCVCVSQCSGITFSSSCHVVVVVVEGKTDVQAALSKVKEALSNSCPLHRMPLVTGRLIYFENLTVARICSVTMQMDCALTPNLTYY